MNAFARLADIRVVILDMDGVLTDGRIGYGDGPGEIKFFDVKDGLGIKLLQRHGIKVGVLSGRESAANTRRAEELELDFCLQGCKEKIGAFRKLTRKFGVEPSECLFVGDDLVDLPVMARCGVGVAVGDAVVEVKRAADFSTSAPGGRGAVREVAEELLRAKGRWQEVLNTYRKKAKPAE